MEYEKTAKTTRELLAKLVERKMDIGNEFEAERLLNSISYYRLATYWFEFRVTNESGDHEFREGTKLATIKRIYDFDKSLRGLFFDAVEVFEISLRRSLASHLALRYKDPFVHKNSELMKNEGDWKRTLERWRNTYLASKEEFAFHHKKKYPRAYLPPIWVTLELATFGELRHFYQNLKNRSDRQAIAKMHGMEEPVFNSWIIHLEAVRNFCAHHSRLWNRRFVNTPSLPKRLAVDLAGPFNRDEKYLPNVYNTILMLNYVEVVISGDQTLYKAVGDLLANYPEIDPANLGYPKV